MAATPALCSGGAPLTAAASAPSPWRSPTAAASSQPHASAFPRGGMAATPALCSGGAPSTAAASAPSPWRSSTAAARGPPHASA
eukprot:scaffold69521_cov45-Phaeocystis_antarctica.AAC.1